MGRLRLIIVGLLVSNLLLAGSALAQEGGEYDLSWSTISGGGGSSTGHSFDLAGAAGQTESETLSGGSYSLAGGFWGGAVSSDTPTPGGEYQIYLPLVVK